MTRASLLSLLFAATAAAQGPPAAPPPKPKAAAVTIFGAPPAAVSPSAPVALDPGKFILVTLNEYTGPVEWDVSGDVAAVKRRPVKAGTLILATRQGTAEPDEYEVPAGPGATDFVRGVVPGTVRLVAWGVKDGRPARIAELTLTVGPRPPPPVPPDPPLPPGPTDPLKAAVEAIYGADGSATKNTDRLTLAAAYRKSAGRLPGATTGATVAQIIIEDRAGVGDRLSAVREVFGGELGKVLPADGGAVLTAAQKTATAEQLIRFALLLEGLR